MAKSNALRWSVVPFNRVNHERFGFDCGVPAMNDWLATIRAVEVEAINESAMTFYKRFGFVTLADDPHHLFLPMSIIRKLRLPPL